MKHPSCRQAGSAAFLILFGIAMFAALSYALMQDRGTNTSMMTDQQAKLAAQDIIAYGNSMAAALQKLKLRGCADNQYDFSNTIWLDNVGAVRHAVGQNATAATGCHVFTDGGVNPIVPPTSYVLSSNSSKGSLILRYAFPSVGTSAEDVVMRTISVKKEICLKINELLGIPNPTNGNLVVSGTGTTTMYTGTFPGTSIWSGYDSVVVGKTAFCAAGTATATSGSFYQVILAR